MQVVVNSPNVKYTENYIESKYDYQYTKAKKEGNQILVSNFNLI